MAENVGSRKDTADLRVSLQLSNLTGLAQILAAEVVTLIKPELVRWFDTFDQSALHSKGPGRTGREQPSERTQMNTRRSTSPNNPGDLSLVRLPDVQAMTGLPKSSIYGLMRAGDFPESVQLGPRAVGWVRSEVQQWAEERVLARRPNLHPSGLKHPSQAERSMTDEVGGNEDASLSE
jgi:prophage regulatory protein